MTYALFEYSKPCVVYFTPEFYDYWSIGVYSENEPELPARIVAYGSLNAMNAAYRLLSGMKP